jgi:hypothetical protein
LDVGFTLNFASSRAYADKFGNNSKIIPAEPANGSEFKKVKEDVS